MPLFTRKAMSGYTYGMTESATVAHPGRPLWAWCRPADLQNSQLSGRMRAARVAGWQQRSAEPHAPRTPGAGLPHQGQCTPSTGWRCALCRRSHPAGVMRLLTAHGDSQSMQAWRQGWTRSGRLLLLAAKGPAARHAGSAAEAACWWSLHS